MPSDQDNSNNNPTTPADATAAKTEEVKGQQHDESGTHVDTRNDESEQAEGAGTTGADASDGTAGVAPNNAQDPSPSDPNAGPDEVDHTATEDKAGDNKGEQVELTDDLKLNDLKKIAADEKVPDAEQFNKPGTSKAAVREAIEKNRGTDQSSADDENVSDDEKARREAAAKDPNQSVNDPDFNPDTRDTNPDNPAGTPDVNPAAPLGGKAVPVSESEAAGAPLGANAVDDTPKASKHADVIKKAKLRVKEINANLEKADPAAYRDAVAREVSNLTNGDPEAAQEITKHWNNQAVV